jgi:hypothetical protein
MPTRIAMLASMTAFRTCSQRSYISPCVAPNRSSRRSIASIRLSTRSNRLSIARIEQIPGLRRIAVCLFLRISLDSFVLPSFGECSRNPGGFRFCLRMNRPFSQFRSAPPHVASLFHRRLPRASTPAGVPAIQPSEPNQDRSEDHGHGIYPSAPG